MANTLRFKRGLVAGIPTGVAGEPLFTTDTFDLYIGNGTTNTRFQKYIASGTTLQYLRGDGSLATFPTNIVTGTGVSGQVAYWSGTNTQVGSNNLFWDATNNRLGIGTNAPATNLEVFGSFAVTDGTTTIRAINSGGLGLFGTLTNHPLVFRTNNTERMRLDASGNLGLGVTPSAWSLTDLAAMQIKNGGFYGYSVNEVGVTSNTYYNAGWKYINSSFATQYSSFNGAHRWFTAPSGTAGNAITFTQPMTLTANGRLLLGSTSEGTQILQVTGDTLLKGSGNTSATTALLVENSDGSDLITARNDGSIFLTSNTGARIYPSIAISGVEIGATGLAFDGRAVTRTAASSSFWFFVSNNSTAATQSLMNFGGGFVPTSGTATWNSTLINPTINQTGGANGVTRGLYVNPTLTAAADWRSIEWSNNTGWGLYGAGTAANLMNGRLGLNSTGLTNVTLRNSLAISGATSSYGYFTDAVIQSGVTTSASYFHISPQTQAAAFTLTNLNGYYVQSPTIGSGNTITNVYGFYGNILAATGRWNFYANGSAANYFNGNTIMGTLAADSGEKLQVNGTMKVTGVATFSSTYGFAIGSIAGNRRIQYGSDLSTAFTFLTDTNSYADLYAAAFVPNSSTIPTNGMYLGAANQLNFSTGSSSRFSLSSTGAATFSSSVSALGNMYVGVASGAGRFVVEDSLSSTSQFTSTSLFTISNSDQTNNNWGTIAFTDGSTQGFAGSIQTKYTDHTNNYGELHFSTRGTSGLATRLLIDTNGAATFSSTLTTGGNILLGATASTVGALNFIKTGTSPVASRLTFGTDGTGYSFAIGKNQSGTVTDLFSIFDSGAANFTTSIQAGTAIAIGTTPDTNKPFKILKNINATVGINFENTSTSSLAFSAIQMGTDVTGGTAFTNLVYGSSGITEAGVYKPSGTSLVNTGAGGLNFLAVSQPIRFFTSSGNGTLRASITNDGDFTQFNGTNPAASTTDAFRMYSADVVAGNAAPHFRTENGAVIKLYQETTGVGNAIFSAGGGTGVLDDSTFDGYTLRQIVKALRNQGILA